jgi:gamma-glutamyltranspeptidase/glutathione hydrolase
MNGISSAEGRRYVIASGCADATAMAAAVLDSGGNIVDAAIAGSAVQCVTSPHLVSIGGDLFAVVKFARDPTVWSVNATGAAPKRADIGLFAARGHSRIPIMGPLSIQTPGLVAGWQALHARWATRPLAALIDPAAALARRGSRVGRRLALSSARHQKAFDAQYGFASAFMAEGKPLREGDMLRQERLAGALEQIVRGGIDPFYRGTIARDIVETVRRAGGIMEQDDLEAVRADISPALTLQLGDLHFATQPPISQGVVLLRALALVHAEHSGSGDVALALAQVRAMRTAFAERLSLLGDGVDARARAEAMVRGAAASVVPAPFAAEAGPETTTLSIMDGDGNAISLINSIFADFGSGVVTDETGILLNNRLCAFFLDPRHPNGLQPGKRTMQTLHSVIVSDAEGVRLAGASPGGDLQPQVNLQVLTRTLFQSIPLDEAVATPRWALHPGTHPHHLADHETSFIQVEHGVLPSVQAAFAEGGFPIVTVEDLGSAKWVMRSPANGRLAAVSDHRRDGAVAGA